MVAFVPVAAHQVAALVGRPIDFPIVAYAGIEDGRVLGLGALSWIGGRCWLEFDAIDIDRHRAARVVRLAHRMLRTAQQMGDTAVYSSRNADHPTSARLLELIGFAPSGETVGGREVWTWPRSEP